GSLENANAQEPAVVVGVMDDAAAGDIFLSERRDRSMVLHDPPSGSIVAYGDFDPVDEISLCGVDFQGVVEGRPCSEIYYQLGVLAGEKVVLRNGGGTRLEGLLGFFVVENERNFQAEIVQEAQVREPVFKMCVDIEREGNLCRLRAARVSDLPGIAPSAPLVG